MDTTGLSTFAQGELVIMLAIITGLMLVPQLKQQNWGRIAGVTIVAVIIINLFNGGQGVWAFIRWILGIIGISL